MEPAPSPAKTMFTVPHLQVPSPPPIRFPHLDIVVESVWHDRRYRTQEQVRDANSGLYTEHEVTRGFLGFEHIVHIRPGGAPVAPVPNQEMDRSC